MYQGSNRLVYAKIIRIFERRMQPTHPVLPFDCLSLSETVPLKVLDSPGDYKKSVILFSARSPAPYFKQLLDASSPDKMMTALEEIVLTRGADPFFMKYTMKNFNLAPLTNKLFKFFTPLVMRNISGIKDIREMIKTLSRRRGLEKQYYLTLLYLLDNDFSKAARSIRTYFNGIGRNSDGIQESEAITKAVSLIGKLNKGETTWTRQIINVSELHEFWMKWALRISLPQLGAPPLARPFFEKAFHYGCMFAGDSKIGAVKLTPLGRKNIVWMFPYISSIQWKFNPPEIQHDIMSVITAFRTMPNWYGGKSLVNKLIPSLADRVFELISLRRFAAASELLARNAHQDLGNVMLSRGKAFFREEVWDKAEVSLREAQEVGKLDALEYYTYLILTKRNGLSGDMGVSKEELMAKLEYAIEYNQKDRLEELLKISEKLKSSGKLYFLQIKAHLMLGDRTWYKKLLEFSKKDSKYKHEAAILAGEILLAGDSTWNDIYSVLRGSLYSSYSAAAWGILAVKAAMMKKHTGTVFILRALEAAHLNPETSIKLLDILVRFGQWQIESWELSIRLMTTMQYSSHLAWLRSVILYRSKFYKKAWYEISRALVSRPSYPPYLKTKKNILFKIREVK